MLKDQSGNETGPPTDDSGRSARASASPPEPNVSALAPVETLQQQADLLGLLDPLDVEPAHVYLPHESAT